MRPRAHNVGMGVYLDDGAALGNTLVRQRREQIAKEARKAEDGLPEARSRRCPTCDTVLSRYTPGPLCSHHSRMETILRDVEAKEARRARRRAR